MKHIHKLSVRVIVAVIVGFLIAGALTKITYTCTPIDGAAGCMYFDKAVMHPNDLLNNKQGSLVKFSATLSITLLITFSLLSAVSLTQKKQN